MPSSFRPAGSPLSGGTAAWASLRRPSSARLWTLAVAVICVAGGSNWVVPQGRLIAESLGAVLLFAAYWSSPVDGGQRTVPGVILAAMLALFALQLVPLPPSVWTALPGRGPLAALDLAVFDAPRWRPFSIAPDDTWRSLLFLVPAIAVFCAVRRGGEAVRWAIVDGFLAAGAVAAVFGLAQAGGSSLGLFYAIGDKDLPIGFFTNHNHQALFVAAMIPLAAARLEAAAARRAGDVLDSGRVRKAPRGGSPLIQMLAISALACVVVLLTASRAGLVLLMLILAATLPAFARTSFAKVVPGLPASRRWVIALAFLGAVILILILAMYSGGALGGALQRSAIASDARFSFWPLVVSAAGQFQPFGSGIGTFVPAYQMFEPRSALAPLFVIHAHNDYLELALEAGFPGIALCLVGIVWLGFAGFRALSGFSRFGAERGYAVTILAAIALHSLVDFPLRTIAVSCLFAACAAIVANPRRDPVHVAVQT